MIPEKTENKKEVLPIRKVSGAAGLFLGYPVIKRKNQTKIKTEIPSEVSI